MEVFHLHHATTHALCKLPDDIAPLIKSFLRQTRLDWRTCRKHEANLIKKLHQIVLKAVEDPDMDDWVFDSSIAREMNTWSLFGMLYIVSWLNKGGIHQYGRPPRCRPTEDHYYDNKYDKWYTHTFMWCCFHSYSYF